MRNPSSGPSLAVLRVARAISCASRCGTEGWLGACNCVWAGECGVGLGLVVCHGCAVPIRKDVWQRAAAASSNQGAHPGGMRNPSSGPSLTVLRVARAMSCAIRFGTEGWCNARNCVWAQWWCWFKASGIVIGDRPQFGARHIRRHCARHRRLAQRVDWCVAKVVRFGQGLVCCH